MEENSNVTDNFENSRKVAWEFIKEKGSYVRDVKKRKNSEVKKTIADRQYEWFLLKTKRIM